MKAKYIIASLVAVCALAIGCTKEKANVLDEVQVSSSYVGVPKAGGSTTIKVTATDSWVINIPEEVDWLTITPQTGSKGETPVAFSAETTLDGRTCEVYLVCKDKIQIINVIQGLAEVANATCKEIAEGPDGKTYRVTGICTKISNTQYGNWYLNDGTVEGDGTYIYGTVNASGAYDWASFGIEIGDEVTVEGPKTTYNGTVELVDAQFISINKSLIKCDSLKIGDVKTSELPIEGGEITAYLSNKGTKLTVEIPDADKNWISMSALDGNKVTFFADANEGGDRSTTVIFKTTDGKKDYTAQATISQKGAILEVSIAEFNAKEDGDSHVYRISGIVTSIAGETDNYGTNLYIQDATGKAYIYGTVNAAGKAEKLSAKGVKAGDIVEVIGKKTSYKSNPQMANGTYQWHKSVTPLTADKVAALSDDDKNDPKNYVMVTGVVTDGSSIPGHKFDLATYGNFELVDESGSAYVYGVSTGWKGETKKFGTLGVKEGDKLTIIAYKTSYTDKTGAKTDELVGMYVSHESGETPEPPTPVVSEYSIDLKYTLGSNAYDDGIATINGTENQKVLKIGTSSKQGSLSVTVPAGAYGVSFYAIAWKGKATKVEFKVGDQAVSKDIAPNDGATGNSPYTITVSDTDKYEINFGGSLSADTEVTVTTPEGTASDKCRAIFFGVKALTDKK